jgi:hypothetical protein
LIRSFTSFGGDPIELGLEFRCERDLHSLIVGATEGVSKTFRVAFDTSISGS